MSKLLLLASTITIILAGLILSGCDLTKKYEPEETTEVDTMTKLTDEKISQVIDELTGKYGNLQESRIRSGVRQAAVLWRQSDGSAEDFEKFALENFIPDDDALDEAFNKISNNFESINGNLNEITLDLKAMLHLDKGKITPIDNMFGGYDISAHIADDMFNNKIAFFIILNFPFFTLEEKEELGADWSRKQWAYARLGDMFISRVPAELKQKLSESMTNADNYISEYNIYMGNLINDNGDTLFPKDLKLITHWGLRDELKSQYGRKGGLEKQEMIYDVMTRIISQEIPSPMINGNKFQWDPKTNKMYKDGKEIEFEKEDNVRYLQILNNFHALRQIDEFSPNYPTYIQRKFDEEMELPQERVENLFIDLMSDSLAKQVAGIIRKRLGRDLRPFDIWYDGFKARSNISETKLNEITRAKYLTPAAFKKDLPNILAKLGFTPEKAEYISSKVVVDPSRGAGHAWGAESKSGVSHLRTRVGKDGMDYKGYNIAVHEFGHNVEQTLTLWDVDYYMMKGVPNTAFTEAIAFVFQGRDLDLLGLSEPNPMKKYLDILDNFWSTYEIMGVSVVDMRVWKWLYSNPNATAGELKKAVIDIAKDVWNEYYADVIGVRDSPILAVYSHMIDYPLYLSAYPIGHLIELQIEQYIEGKNFALELERMCVQGRLTPDLWMQRAVGNKLSIEPTIKAARNAVNAIGN